MTVFSPLESRSASDRVSFLAIEDRSSEEEPPLHEVQGEEAGARPSCILQSPIWAAWGKRSESVGN